MFASAIRDLKNKNKKGPRVQLVNRQNIEIKLQTDIIISSHQNIITYVDTKNRVIARSAL